MGSMNQRIWLSLGVITLLAACSAEPSANTGSGGQSASASGSGGADGQGGQGGTEIGFGGFGGSGGGSAVGCADVVKEASYAGCEFWPTPVSNQVWSIFDYAVVVGNAGSAPADIKVTLGGDAIASLSVAPGAVEKIFLPWIPALKGPDFVCTSFAPFNASIRAPKAAYRLESSSPVTVYQFNPLEFQPAGGPPGKDWSTCGQPNCSAQCYSFSNDASLLLPAASLTQSYRVTGIQAATNIGSYVAITGIEEATAVTVTLAGDAEILAGADIPHANPGEVVKLNVGKGEVVELVGPGYRDFSGTLIQSDKPIQVIHGTPCSAINGGACDHIEETVSPIETWGTRYFATVPTSPAGTVVGHVVRLFGTVDDTALTYPSGAPPGAPSSLSAGQVVDLGIVSVDFEVVGSHELAVGTFQLSGQQADPGQGIKRGDPAQSAFASVEQYRTDYVFLAPDDYEVSYADIVVPMGATVELNGKKLDTPITPIGAEFGVMRHPLTGAPGDAYVLHASAPVGLQVIGYGLFTSYQVPGGLSLSPIAPPPPPPPK